MGCNDIPPFYFPNHVIDLRLDKIAREVHNERRFEQVSVVVDYDMPEINGLELSRKRIRP